MSNVTKFPIKTEKRIQNRRGRGAVSCLVSLRWLRFSEAYPQATEFGTPVALDVMTESGDTERKLCTMLVTVEDLEKVLDYIKGK
ncbi:MAG: hypothetical protein ACRBCJ_14940 [Hyphomicrobiaceae bacterium]